MSVIVAKPTSGGSSSTPTTTNCLPAVSIQQLIPNGTTVPVDFVDVGSWRAVKWYVLVMNVGGTLIKAYEVYATHHNGSNPTFNVYAIQGSTIAQVANVTIVGSSLTLSITNTQGETLIAYVTRLGVPISKSAVNGLSGIEITQAHASVAPSTTVTVDSFLYASVRAAKWLVSVTDPSGNKKVSQVYAMMKAGLVGNDVEYSMIGDEFLNYTIDAVAVGFQLNLNLTNNDVVDYRVDVTRIPIITPLPPSCGLTAGDISIWLPDPVTIPAGSTVDVDSNVVIPGHDGAKWLVGIYEAIGNKVLAFELLANRHALTTTDFVEYGLLGDSLNITASVSISGLNMVLTITNNEPNAVTVNLARIPISI
jgi:hypothetical protein